MAHTKNKWELQEVTFRPQSRFYDKQVTFSPAVWKTNFKDFLKKLCRKTDVADYLFEPDIVVLGLYILDGHLDLEDEEALHAFCENGTIRGEYVKSKAYIIRRNGKIVPMKRIKKAFLKEYSESIKKKPEKKRQPVPEIQFRKDPVPCLIRNTRSYIRGTDRHSWRRLLKEQSFPFDEDTIRETGAFVKRPRYRMPVDDYGRYKNNTMSSWKEQGKKTRQWSKKSHDIFVDEICDSIKELSKETAKNDRELYPLWMFDDLLDMQEKKISKDEWQTDLCEADYAAITAEMEQIFLKME